MNRHLVTLALLLGIVVVIAGSLVLGAPRSDGGPGEQFGGADAAVTEMLEEDGVEPWFTPLFEPDSGEVESGIFAAQAALGAGVLGYCIGVLHGRRRARDVRTDETSPSTPTAPAPASPSEV